MRGVFELSGSRRRQVLDVEGSAWIDGTAVWKRLPPAARVVNISHHRSDQYIGRGSPFGYPFVIGPDGDRASVLAQFRVYADARFADDPHWAALVRDLKGMRLGCCCKPKDCHGDWYVECLTMIG